MLNAFGIVYPQQGQLRMMSIWFGWVHSLFVYLLFCFFLKYIYTTLINLVLYFKAKVIFQLERFQFMLIFFYQSANSESNKAYLCMYKKQIKMTNQSAVLLSVENIKLELVCYQIIFSTNLFNLVCFFLHSSSCIIYFSVYIINY